METYTVLIIDDEKLARDSIKVLLQSHPIWKIIGEAIDGKEAVHLVNQLKPDLIFLDIDMPRMYGTDSLKYLKHKPYIVFTTGYDQYAIKAFDENAIDYLLKPYTDKRFYQALARVELKIKESQSSQKIESILQLLHQKGKGLGETEKKIAIHANGKIVLLEIHQISWVNASGNYVEIFTENKKYLHFDSMNNMEQLLPEPGFIRIHRSHIVKQNYITAFRKHTNGEYFVVLKNGVELKLSRSNRDKVKMIIDNSEL